ncbi:glutathione S-transferase family protein [Lutibaculum baratangense]|uniref:Glutathione S-transferase n=1 Tax=Lutibaculum baratangense AMV1 TaxID=631454 RepID=V4RIK7_9HYPH|nr:glutathione S-transferase [Lutibaculum baratangense]ESR23115.1 Glutathione S-transferase [Lutibaculum baratangense AMV1]
MRLIGMLDSPYVRRVAVTLNALGLAYEHESLSVFRNFEEFGEINPLVKAPTLVTDEGIVLMDSTLILEHIARLAPEGRALHPDGIASHARSQRILGLALAACDKTVQIVYERTLRPEEKRHEPWLDRVRGQVRNALAMLETEVTPAQPWLFGAEPMQADITTAIAWTFHQRMLPDPLPAADHPAIARLAERAEALPEFLASPYDG